MPHPDVAIEHLGIDSRHIEFPAATLFFAIRTKNRDGHRYIADAYRAGVRNFVVSQHQDEHQFPDANFLVVADTVAALQAIGSSYRNLFKIPIIGITGSNGKTVVKEWLYQVLSRTFNTVRSPGSYNSQIGVPLSVWQLQDATELGIFEAGISQPGEMGKLQPIIRPTIGIFTNIGDAHREGFRDVEHKILEKLV